MELVKPDASGGLPSLEAVRTALARRSLAHFVRAAWHVLEPTTAIEWNWHLQAMCDHVQALLEGRITKGNLLINVPPGSMKSLIVSVFAPAWWWLDHPEWRAIFSSANPRVTVRDSVKCRDLIESDWYRQTFTPQWSLVADQNTKTLYKTTRNGFRMAVSANAKITGDRAHALFWDDLLDATDAASTSKLARETVNYWYDQAFANRLADPRTGIRCGICQRLHDDDPAGHVLKEGAYEALVIPQVYQPPKDGVKVPSSIGWTDPRTKAGALMFPSRFNSVFLRAEKKRLGTQGFEAQHNQRPAPDSGIIFKSDWLTRRFKFPEHYAAMSVPQLMAVLGIERIAVGWDTALGEKQQNDYTAFTVIGQTKNRFLVLDHGKDKRDAPGVKRWVKDIHAKWQPYAVPIEGQGSSGGKAVVQMLREDTTVPAKEVPNIDKVIRAGKVAPSVETMVWFPDGEPWVADLVDSLQRFPRATHDDDVDSFCITLEELVFGEVTTGLLEFYRQQAAAAAARKAAGG